MICNVCCCAPIKKCRAMGDFYWIVKEVVGNYKYRELKSREEFKRCKKIAHSFH